VQSFCVECHFEASAVIVECFKLIIVTLYHSPLGNADIFLDRLEGLLTFVTQWSKYTVVVGGDINNKFNVNNSKSTVKDFKNILRQNDFYCLNYAATRGNNCLDNIFVNCPRHQVGTCKVFDFSFSDHRGLFFNLKCKFIDEGPHCVKLCNNVCVGSCVNCADQFRLVLPVTAVNDLINSLLSFDWPSFLMSLNYLDANQIFNEIFEICLRKLVYFQKLKKNKPCENV
jgi:hypothetical protein